jgi:hypothetical protein
VKFKHLTVATVSRLSWNGGPDEGEIFLYGDGSIPTANAKNMQEYLERLEILARLEFAAEDSGRPALAGGIIASDGG